MTLVEKVAVAIYNSKWGNVKSIDELSIESRDESLEAARAAIEAMRQPTKFMVALSSDETTWHRMIEAALNEKPEVPNADLIARLRAVANDLITGKNVASAAMLCTEAADVLEKQKYAPKWELRPKTLLDALWLQLGQALTGSAQIRQCEHCGDWFEAGRGTGRRLDSKFCSDEHRVAFNSLKRSKEK